jgi:hypothetical protein
MQDGKYCGCSRGEKRRMIASSAQKGGIVMLPRSMSHVALCVRDFDLKGKGVTFVAPPHILGKTKAGTIRSAFVQDPDGILLQIDEITPAQA